MEAMQSWTQPRQGYRPIPPGMQRSPYTGITQPTSPLISPNLPAMPSTMPTTPTMPPMPNLGGLSRKERQEAKRLTEEANFSYTGYQVVRREFISHRFDPAMTIKGHSITFNSSCISKLEDATYIQFLINPTERKLAIRPCDEGARDAVRWCTVKGDKRKSREITCKPFTKKLYELMGWDTVYRYKLQGMRINYQGESLYLFDLSAKEAFLPQTRDPATRKVKRSEAILSEEMQSGFGLSVDDHAASTQIDLSQGFESSDITAADSVPEPEPETPPQNQETEA